MDKPPWLKPNTLVLHEPSATLFVLKKLQKQKGGEELLLLSCEAAPTPPTALTKEESHILRCPLSECRPAQWSDVQGQNVVIYEDGGRRLLTHPTRQLAQIPIEASEDRLSSYTLEPDPVYDAAQSLAVFMGFGSTVLEPTENYHNRPQWR
jgi:hypothetical protein